MTPRGWALLTLAGLTLALVVLAALLIPWHRPPAPRADQLAALGDLPAEQVAKGPGVPRRAAPGGYAALASGCWSPSCWG